jgi:hypothetical protein
MLAKPHQSHVQLFADDTVATELAARSETNSVCDDELPDMVEIVVMV